MIRKLLLLAGLAFSLSACAFGSHRPERSGDHGPPPGASLLRYDANHDGRITRAELEAGLKAEFGAADTKHAGCLDADAVRAYNEARWAEDRSYTPLVDWTETGCIDFSRFAAAARSLFAQLDLNNDGVLTPDEIKGGPNSGQAPPERSGGRRGRPGGGQGGGRGGGRGGGEGSGEGPGG